MNDGGRAHNSASIRPRSCPSISGRQPDRQPSAESSRVGSIRPRAVSSRIISAARAANRKSFARVIPDESVVEKSPAPPAADTNARRRCTAFDGLRTTPGGVNKGGGYEETEDTDGGSVAGLGGSVAGLGGSPSSHGEPIGPPPVSGSRILSSTSLVVSRSPAAIPPS